MRRAGSNKRPSRKGCAPLRKRRRHDLQAHLRRHPRDKRPTVSVEQTQGGPYVSPEEGRPLVSWRWRGDPFWLIRCGHQSSYSQEKRGAFRIDYRKKLPPNP